MAWTDYFVDNVVGTKAMVSPTGRPYASTEIAKGEFIEVWMTTDQAELPFKIVFRDDVEERVYGYAGTKDLARKIAIEVAELRLNSRELATSVY